MKKFKTAALVIGLLLGAASRLPAQDEPHAILDKAIKAHGGADKLAKLNAMHLKSKGKLDLLGGIDLTKETLVQIPGKFKDIMQMDVMGNKVTVTTVFNGTKGWIKANDMDVEVTDTIMEALKEAAYFMDIGRLTALRQAKSDLSLLGEIKINDRPAVGVKIASKGHPDFNVYFDKQTWLTLKTEHRTKDVQSNQEVNEEIYITEFQDIDGLKTAKKMLIHRDGKKFMEAEVVEAKFLDKIDDSEFTKP
jgi:hypothetical protein